MGAVFRAIFGYCFLVLMVRVAGRRPGKQLTPFEFVLIFFMGGIMLAPMIGDDRSLTNASLTIATIAMTHFVLSWAKQISPAVGRVIDGTPLVLLEKGRWQTETMAKMAIQGNDVMATARDQSDDWCDALIRNRRFNMTTVLYAVAGYWFLLLTVRILSRRPGAQMTPFEFVLIFLIGGAIILATVGNDHSETNAVCAVLTVALMHRLVSFLKQRFPHFGFLVDGTPLMLLKDREWQTEVMGKMRIQDMDVIAAARTKGLKDLSQIRYAILERLGSISIIKEEKK